MIKRLFDKDYIMSVDLKLMKKMDINRCAEIHKSVYGGDFKDQTCDGNKFSLKMNYVWYFERFIVDEDKYAFCILKGESVVGYIVGLLIPSMSGGYNFYLDSMVIDSQYQKNGYGSEAINLLQNMIPNVEIIWLCTQPNIPAYKMYEKQGFFDTNMHMLIH